MNPAGYFRSWVDRFIRRSRVDEDLRNELRSHIRHRADDLERSGLDRVEAERRARIEFGSTVRFEEECREMLGGRAFETILQDARFALRMLRKSPGFAAVAILTVALAVGATTAIFSVVDATLLHPLPYPHPEELVSVVDDLPGVGARDVGLSQPEWQDLQSSGIFRYISPAWYDDNNLTGSAHPARVSLQSVAPSYFSVLGVRPRLGRAFVPENRAVGYTQEVVISDGLWKRAFGRDPRILTRKVRLDTDLYHVIGVMPPGFHAPGQSARDRNTEVWAATTFAGAPLPDHPPRAQRNLPTVIGRLAPGLTVAAAQRRLDALVASLQRQFPDAYPAQSRWNVRLAPLQDTIVGDVRRPLFLMLGAVGMVLLIGCVNIASLLLARASARRREIAVRRALGAADARLTQQLLTEGLLLSVLGGIAGVLILFCTKGLLLDVVPDSVPRLNELAVRWDVLLFSLAASLAAGVLFGLAPVLHLGRGDRPAALQLSIRGSTASRDQTRMRRILVVAEFAFSLVLLIGAALLLRSFRDLLDAPLGFDPRRVMTVRTRLPYPNYVQNDPYATPAQKARLYREVLGRIQKLPGVEEAAVGDLGAVPLGHDRHDQSPPFPLILEGREAPSRDGFRVDGSIVTPEYFPLMGMTLLQGRFFGGAEDERAPAVAVINGAMSRTYWPGESPLGKRLKVSRTATEWTTVVGVVGDARTESLEDARVPQVYVDLYQKGAHHLAIFLRGDLDVAAIPEQVRREVQSVDPALPVFGAQSLPETVSASLATRRFSMEMVALFALTALLLAALGVYGVMSCMVSERTREIGIQLALGAPRGRVLRLVLRQGVRLAIVGSALGLVGAAIASHWMAGLLYGVRPADPLTFAAVAFALIGAAVFASLLPALRATRVDPMIALREG